MLGGQPAALDVVGEHRWHVVAVHVDEDDGHPRVDEAGEVAGRRLERQDEDAVGPAALGDRGEVLLAVHGGLDVEQDQVVEAPVEGGDDAPEPLDGRGVGEEGDHDAQGLAATPGEPLGERVGPEVQRRHGLQHPRAGARADLRAAVQDPADGPGTHAGSCRHVADGDHRTPPRKLVEGRRHHSCGTASTTMRHPKPERVPLSMEALPRPLPPHRGQVRSAPMADSYPRDDDSPPFVLVERPRPHVAVVRLHRPARLNALSIELVSELHDTLGAIGDENDTWVVVLTGVRAGVHLGARPQGLRRRPEHRRPPGRSHRPAGDAPLLPARAPPAPHAPAGHRRRQRPGLRRRHVPGPRRRPSLRRRVGHLQRHRHRQRAHLHRDGRLVAAPPPHRRRPLERPAAHRPGRRRRRGPGDGLGLPGPARRRAARRLPRGRRRRCPASAPTASP